MQTTASRMGRRASDGRANVRVTVLIVSHVAVVSASAIGSGFSDKAEDALILRRYSCSCPASQRT